MTCPSAPGTGDLARAQQRHAVEAQAAGGNGREVGVEVVGQGEDAADDVVGADLVAGHDLAHELLGGVEDGGRLVDVDGGGAAQGEEAHRGAIMPVMRRAAVALLLCLAGCGGGDKLKSPPPSAPRSLTVTSPDFPANGADPVPLLVRRRQGAAGPALRRRPRRRGRAGARGRRPRRGRLRALDRLRPAARRPPRWAATGLPAGAREGENSTGATGWTPPCPPSGTHRYEFRLYWLKRKSGLGAGAKPDDVIAAVRKSAGGSGLLVGRYARR